MINNYNIRGNLHRTLVSFGNAYYVRFIVQMTQWRAREFHETTDKYEISFVGKSMCWRVHPKNPIASA